MKRIRKRQPQKIRGRSREWQCVHVRQSCGGGKFLGDFSISRYISRSIVPLILVEGTIYSLRRSSVHDSDHDSDYATDRAMPWITRYNAIRRFVTDWSWRKLRTKEREEWIERKSGRKGWWKKKKRKKWWRRRKSRKEKGRKGEERETDKLAGWVGGWLAEEEVWRKFLVGKPVFLG